METKTSETQDRFFVFVLLFKQFFPILSSKTKQQQSKISLFFGHEQTIAFERLLFVENKNFHAKMKTQLRSISKIIGASRIYLQLVSIFFAGINSKKDRNRF
jgi:hypothetical protein